MNKTTTTTRPIWKNPSFALLWAGKLTSGFGDRITFIAITWWVLEVTGRPDLLGLVMLVSAIPPVILSPFAGAIADRISRKWIIVVTDIGRGIVLLTGAAVLYSGGMTVELLIIGSILVNILMTLFMPAAQSIMPNIVHKDHLVQANSLMQVNMNLIGLIGPAVGGFLLAAIDMAGCFLIVGISYLISAVTESFIQATQKTTKAQAKTSMLSEIKEGLSFIMGRSLLFGLSIVFSVLNFFAAPLGSVLLPAAILTTLNMTSVELGLSMSAMSAGVILTATTLSIRPQLLKRHSYGMFTGVSTVGAGVSLIGIMLYIALNNSATATVYLIGLIGLSLIIGIGSNLTNVTFASYLQKTLPDEIRGRTFGLITTLMHVLQPVSLGIVGLSLAYVSIPFLLTISGILIIVCGMYLFLLPGFREMN